MITSYAQNFEDVMLWRALQHVDNGFYIDVGANDPDVESVTRLFYEHGWTGINIEPVEQWFRRLKEIRTRDINLKLAVGASSGQITLYDVPDTGLCTIDKATAERHEKDKGYEKNAFRAELRTLAEICESYFRPEIHFLKIDVERAELQVIQGMDFARFRPWIVVVEATLPNLPTEDYAAWEPLLLESDYRLVYLDGLNRFYVAEETYTDLVGCFRGCCADPISIPHSPLIRGLLNRFLSKTGCCRSCFHLIESFFSNAILFGLAERLWFSNQIRCVLRDNAIANTQAHHLVYLFLFWALQADLMEQVANFAGGPQARER